MIAIAWVDTMEGRRWVIGRAAMLLALGILVWVIGRVIDPRVMWAGVSIVVFGTAVLVWAVVHRSRGMPVWAFPSKPCIVSGCEGTMHFRTRPVTLTDAEDTLPWEWPWRPRWQCAKDAAHMQLIAEDEAREIMSTTRSVGRSAKDSIGDPTSRGARSSFK
jgi:hypothetical protein